MFGVCLSILFIMDGVGAAPGDVAKYLMNDPITRFDWGIYQTREFLESRLSKTYTQIFVSAGYSWDSDRIEIGITYLTDKKPLVSKAKNLCKEMMGAVKFHLGVDAKTGESFLPDGSTTLQGFFSHEAHRPLSEPADLYREIDNMTNIKVSVPVGSEKRLICKSALKKAEILYGDPEQ